MEKRKVVLCVIDTQNDFITGALRNEEAIKTVPNIVKKINEFEGSAIYATMDTHDIDYLGTNEGKKLPVTHCVKYTDGWLIEPSIKNALDDARKRGVHVEYVEKPTFGSFELIDQLTLDGRGRELEVYICGFVSSICVVSNAIMLKAALYNKGEINVIKDCVAGLNESNNTAALEVMSSCQINLV